MTKHMPPKRFVQRESVFWVIEVGLNFPDVVHDMLTDIPSPL